MTDTFPGARHSPYARAYKRDARMRPYTPPKPAQRGSRAAHGAGNGGLTGFRGRQTVLKGLIKRHQTALKGVESYVCAQCEGGRMCTRV